MNVLCTQPQNLLQAIAARYGVLLEKAGIALRGLFIINPEGIIQQITINDLVRVWKDDGIIPVFYIVLLWFRTCSSSTLRASSSRSSSTTWCVFGKMMALFLCSTLCYCGLGPVHHHP
jgi:hypothetical protein